MANFGDRKYCICKKALYVSIRKNEVIAFNENYIYEMSYNKRNGYYKIYGKEFIYNCKIETFCEYFKILNNRNTVKVINEEKY